MNNLFTYSVKKKGYGEFPYIIMRVACAIYIQIPIHFLKRGEKFNIINQPGTHIYDVPEEILSLSKEKQIESLHKYLLYHTKRIKKKIENDRDIDFWLCLVEGKEKAYYFKEDGINFRKSIPNMGTLITQQNEIIAMNLPHYWAD